MAILSPIRTYNPKMITISLGGHIVSGYADDSFVSIEPKGEGMTSKTGCDGEIVRSTSPDKTYVVKISLLQTSDTNAYLQRMQIVDADTGLGMFPIEVKDLRGSFLFFSAAAWVSKPASRSYGKEATNREWELHTAEGVVYE